MNRRPPNGFALGRAALLTLLVALISVGYMAAVDAGLPFQPELTETIVTSLNVIPGMPTLGDRAGHSVPRNYPPPDTNDPMIGGARYLALVAGLLPLVVLVYIAVRYSHR